MCFLPSDWSRSVGRKVDLQRLVSESVDRIMCGTAMDKQQYEQLVDQGIALAQQMAERAPDAVRNVPPNEWIYLAVVFGLILVMNKCFRRVGKPGLEGRLGRKLFQLNRDNWLTVRNLVAGGIHAAGGTGSGKTSSFKQLFRAIMSLKDTSLLVMCAKRDDTSPGYS